MAGEPLIIQPESPENLQAISRVNAAAFGRPDEADLVEALRGSPSVILSLVSSLEGQVVGHALFTVVELRDQGESVTGAGLGPIAVAPEFQARGIGGKLVRAGLALLPELGFEFCVVLGHSDYYPRFGFVPSVRFGIVCQWPVPEEVFMAVELIPGALAGRRGTIYYAPAFDGV